MSLRNLFWRLLYRVRGDSARRIWHLGYDWPGSCFLRYGRPDYLRAAWSLVSGTVSAFAALIWRGRYDYFELSLKNVPGDNSRCYCPVGNASTLWAKFGGFYLRVSLCRYPGPIPCVCDEALHESMHLGKDYGPDCCTVGWKLFEERHVPNCPICRDPKNEICSDYQKA